MPWNYLPSLLQTTGATADMTRVRFLVGDTDESNKQLQDEEIYYILEQEPVITYAAAAACDALSAKYAFLVNINNGALRVSAAARHKHYITLADRLRKMGPGDVPGGIGGGVRLAEIFVGGASRADRDATRQDTDIKPTPFAVGQDDFPGTGGE
jgi:hypothetical protein